MNPYPNNANNQNRQLQHYGTNNSNSNNGMMTFNNNNQLKQAVESQHNNQQYGSSFNLGGGIVGNTNIPSMHNVRQHATQSYGPIEARRLFVASLAYHTTDQTLFDFFAQYGDLEEAVIIKDKQNNMRSKCFGFVIYRTPEGAQAALQQPTKIIDSRQVRVSLATEGQKRYNAPAGTTMPNPSITIPSASPITTTVFNPFGIDPYSSTLYNTHPFVSTTITPNLINTTSFNLAASASTPSTIIHSAHLNNNFPQNNNNNNIQQQLLIQHLQNRLGIANSSYNTIGNNNGNNNPNGGSGVGYY